MNWPAVKPAHARLGASVSVTLRAVWRRTAVDLGAGIAHGRGRGDQLEVAIDAVGPEQQVDEPGAQQPGAGPAGKGCTNGCGHLSLTWCTTVH